MLKVLAALLAVSSLVACASSGQLGWRRPDGTHDPKQLAEDVDACEAHLKMQVGRGRPPPSVAGARPYGGWGHPDFEFCMQQKNWVLASVTSTGTATPLSGPATPASKDTATPPSK